MYVTCVLYVPKHLYIRFSLLSSSISTFGPAQLRNVEVTSTILEIHNNFRVVTVADFFRVNDQTFDIRIMNDY